MGIKKFLGIDSGKGYVCKQNQDGSETCAIIEKDGDNLRATGSSFSPLLNENTCDVVLGGESRILEEDEEMVKKVIEAKKAGCRKGIA